MEIMEGGSNQTETPLANDRMTPLLTQYPYKYPPPVDAPDAPDSPFLGAQENLSDAAYLVSVVIIPGERLIAANDNIIGVYQNCVQRNPITRLDGRI